MRKITYIMLLFVSILQGQQLATISQMGAIDYFFNPAVIDLQTYEYNEHTFDAHAVYRQQWSSFEGAPQTAIIGGRYLNSESKMSLSGFISHDQFGLSKYTQVQVGYAYQLLFDRSSTHGLSLGLYLAGSQYRIDQTMIDVQETNDPLLSGAIETGIFPSLGLGAYYFRKLEAYYSDTYLFAGLSGEQVIPSDVAVEGTNGSQGNLKREPHLHAFVGFRKYFSSKDYIEPVFRVSKTFWSPLHLRGIVRGTILDQKAILGIGLSSEFQFYLEAGFSVHPSIKVHYGISSHMQTTLSRQTGLSHQLLLSYQFLSGGY